MTFSFDEAMRTLERVFADDPELLARAGALGLEGEDVLDSAAGALVWAQPPWWAMASRAAAAEWQLRFEALWAAGVTAGAIVAATTSGGDRLRVSLRRASVEISAVQDREGRTFEPFGIDADAARKALMGFLCGAEAVLHAPEAARYDFERRREWANVMWCWVLLAILQGAVAVSPIAPLSTS